MLGKVLKTLYSDEEADDLVIKGNTVLWCSVITVLPMPVAATVALILFGLAV